MLQLQATAGNAAVAAAIEAVVVDRRGPGSSSGAVQGPVVQRTGSIEEAIASGNADSVGALSPADLAKASSGQRLKLIDIVLASGDDSSLPRLWDSFGGGLAGVAVQSPAWRRSMKEHAPVMRQSREVRALAAAFALDVRDVAWAYLRENDAAVSAEMKRLGIPEEEGIAGPPTALQAQELARTQKAAAKLAEAQKKREELRRTEIAFHRKFVEKGSETLPAGGVQNLEERYEPVYFDPDVAFSASDQPTDYIPGLRTWSKTYDQHVALTQLIEACFTAHPALYALSRADLSGSKAAGASAASAEGARTVLGAQLRAVRANISKARDLVPALALQMAPIHDQLLRGAVRARADLKRSWNNEFLKPLGEDVVAQQQPGPWWQQLGAMTLEGAAYVVVGIATGGIGPVLLAGGQAAISVARYQALETASRANVTPDTVLIRDGEVDAAAAAALMNVAMAFLSALGAARAAFAARISSQAGRALAKEVGEDVARVLLTELTPEAAMALKNRIGAPLLKELSRTMGAAHIERLAQTLTASELEALMRRVPADVLGPLVERIGSAPLTTSLLGKCADPSQLGRFLDRVPDAAMLDRLLAGTAQGDLARLEKVLAALGDPAPGTIRFNIGGELEAKAGQVIINPGRRAMPVEKIRSLRPEALVIEAAAERIPFPDGCSRMVVGRKLPNSINWDVAAPEFNRVLQSGGSVMISVYGPADKLRRALAANGFTVHPPASEEGSALVIAVKR